MAHWDGKGFGMLEGSSLSKLILSMPLLVNINFIEYMVFPLYIQIADFFLQRSAFYELLMMTSENI